MKESNSRDMESKIIQSTMGQILGAGDKQLRHLNPPNIFQFFHPKYFSDVIQGTDFAPREFLCLYYASCTRFIR